MASALKRENPAPGASGNGVHSAQSNSNSGATGNIAHIRPPGKPDARMAHEFLDALDPGGSFTFQTFPDKDKASGGPPRVLHGTLKAQGRTLAELNQQGAGVFVTVNETDGRGRRRENITKPRALFLDFDAPDPGRLERLLALPGPEPSAIVETSPGKHHVYWAVDGLSLEEWDGLQRVLLAAFASEGADEAVKDRTRVLRIPGFWHMKGEPFPCKLVHANGKRYSAEKLRTWVHSLAGHGETAGALSPPESVQAPRAEATAPVQGLTLKIAEDALNALPPEHADEYSQWVAVGMALHHQFEGDPEAWNIWDGWSQWSNKYDNEPATWAKWQTFEAGRGGGVSMRSVLHHAEANGWQRPAGVERAAAAADEFPMLGSPAPQTAVSAPRGPLFRLVGDMLREPPRLQWLVSGFIEHPTVGQMFGDPKAGKSFITLDLAASIATGTPWHGRDVTQGRVMYIAGEGHGGLRRRVKAWEIGRDVPLADAPFHMSERSIEFARQGMLDQLRAEIDALDTPPVLIVIDTLARAAAGMDENSTRDMGVFMADVEGLAHRYACSVLLVHHTGHGNKERARGASAIHGAIDVGMRVEDNHGVRELSCVKMKDGEDFAPEYFELVSVELPPEWIDSDGRRMQSAVPVQSDQKARALPERPTGKNQRAAFDVAVRMCDERTELAGGDEPGVLDAREWRTRCADEGIGRKRFPEVRKSLAAGGFITMGGDGETFTIAAPFFPVGEAPG